MNRTFKLLMVVGIALTTTIGCAGRRVGSRTTSVPVVAPPQPVYPGAVPAPPGRVGNGLPPGAIPAPPGSGLPAGAMVVPPGSVGAAPPGPSGPSRPDFAQPFPTAPQPSQAPQNQFPIAPPTPPAPPGPQGAAPPNNGIDRLGYRWQPGAVPGNPPGPMPGTAPGAAPPAAEPPPVNARGPQSPAPSGPSVLLLPPQADPDARSPRGNNPVQLYPPQGEPNTATRPYPVGISGFDRAREHVATGQPPSLEGLDWLAKQGYRTVVFLHMPGVRSDADRVQVEKRGMTFIPLEIDPRALSPEVVDAFLRMLRDPSSGKTFVYDLDGALAGPLWYLSYRVIDQDEHEVALIRARQLGLREERDGTFRDMWDAVRRHLTAR